MSFKALALATFMLASGAASAASVVAIPTGWKLESYGEKGVALWGTGSPCTNGQILLPGTATITDHNRLYATVMAAKISASKVFVYYDVVGAQCIVTSFGLQEG